MEWDNFRRSDNIEDRRGDDSAGGGDGGGGGGGFGTGGAGGLGLGTIIVLGLIGWALGIDPRVLINGAEMVNNVRNGGQVQQPAQRSQYQPQRQAQNGTPRAPDGCDGPVRRRHPRRDGRHLVPGSCRTRRGSSTSR